MSLSVPEHQASAESGQKSAGQRWRFPDSGALPESLLQGPVHGEEIPDQSILLDENNGVSSGHPVHVGPPIGCKDRSGK